MIRKDVMFAIVTTFCLCALMFAVIPIRSANPYDPWADMNDDGKVNMFDIGYVASRFGTVGDAAKPVNVTNWEVDGYHKYSVDVIIDTANASVGNTEPVRLFVHVTYQGSPVIATTFNSFHTNGGISGPLGTWPDGPLLYIWSNNTGDIYEFRSTPNPPAVWLAGRYVFIIGVRVPAPPESPVYTGEVMGSFTL